MGASTASWGPCQARDLMEATLLLGQTGGATEDTITFINLHRHTRLLLSYPNMDEVLIRFIHGQAVVMALYRRLPFIQGS
jgi:hypothetical protein